MYYLYLNCEGGTGYFVGIVITSNGQEVRVHSDKRRAKAFTNKQQAYLTAKQLKNTFKCVYTYTIV